MELLTLASGERMAVEERGQGAPVLLLPGVLGTRETWRPVANLISRDHRVVMVDLLGFGDSSRPSELRGLWADAQAAAVAEVLDALGLSGATIAGHDFGGPTAAQLVAARPDLVGRLCLCSSNVTSDTPIPMPIRLITWPLVGGFFERLLMSAPVLAMSLRQAVGESHESVRVEPGDASQRRSTRLIFAAALRELEERYQPIEAALRGADVPSLVLWGGRDPFFSVEQGRRTAELASGELRLYETAGHFLPLERPDDVAGEIASFAATESVTA